MNKFAFVGSILYFLIYGQVFAQVQAAPRENRAVVVQQIEDLIFDVLMEKVSPEHFCKEVSPLYQQAESRGLLEQRWRRTVRGIMTHNKCPPKLIV
jgi:hypothetical protein